MPILALMFLQPCGEQGQGIDPPETQHNILKNNKKKAGKIRSASEMDGVVFQTGYEIAA